MGIIKKDKKMLVRMWINWKYKIVVDTLENRLVVSQMIKYELLYDLEFTPRYIYTCPRKIKTYS